MSFQPPTKPTKPFQLPPGCSLHNPLVSPLPFPNSLTATAQEPSEPPDNADIPRPLAVFVTIIGFGSLLSIASARFTFPDLKDFRLCSIRHFRRIFQHSAPLFFQRGIAKAATLEQASLSVQPVTKDFHLSPEKSYENRLLVTAFEIPLSAMALFYSRESEFRWLEAPLFQVNGENSRDKIAVGGVGLLCAAYSDYEYFHDRLHGSAEAFNLQYGRYGIPQVWEETRRENSIKEGKIPHKILLPCRVYLRHCLLACEKTGERFQVGKQLLDNFLDSTDLADGRRTLREYLEENPDIYEEKVPEELKDRYSG